MLGLSPASHWINGATRVSSYNVGKRDADHVRWKWKARKLGAYYG